MNADKALSVAGAIVTVALVTTIVSHPNSSKVIGAVGSLFQGSIRAAMGN